MLAFMDGNLGKEKKMSSDGTRPASFMVPFMLLMEREWTSSMGSFGKENQRLS